VLQRFEAARERIRDELQALVTFVDAFGEIATAPTEIATEPHWQNVWLSPIDAAALYSYLARRAPRHYLEIGSGHSTKFAARARRDNALTTQFVSIDPHPRAEIDELCDTVVRKGLQDVDIELFDMVEAGDVLFCDGSHCVFQNSDATVFFTEVLPRLAPGVTVGVHDIFLPRDYPPDWAGRYYSEQYLLTSWLLAGSRLDILLPACFAAHDDDLSPALEPLSRVATIAPLWSYDAGGFWFVTT
jgi:hypothetical protein